MKADLKEKITKDFNLIATFEKDNWTRNNHFSEYLIKNLPASCHNVLEIGCGIGTLTRKLAERAEHITAIDLSANMIETAKGLSKSHDNIDFQVADILETEFPAEHFDAIVSVATFHHIPLEELLPKLKIFLRKGGKLLVLDILEVEDFRDYLTASVSIPVSVFLNVFHNGLARTTREKREAWENHSKTDHCLTYSEAKRIYSQFLDGAIVTRHLFFRFSVIWEK